MKSSRGKDLKTYPLQVTVGGTGRDGEQEEAGGPGRRGAGRRARGSFFAPLQHLEGKRVGR